MVTSYAAPDTLDETLAILADAGADGVVLAGGMALVPAIKAGRLAGKYIVNIKQVPLGREPRFDAVRNCLTLGALVRHRDIEMSTLVAEKLPAFARLERVLASVQIRNHGTISGNLCSADQPTDPPCVMAALGARLLVASREGTRTAAADDWIASVSITQLRPGELVTEIEINLLAPSEGFGYARLTPRRALSTPLVCAAARLGVAQNGAVASARVFVGAAGPCPQRMARVEAAITGVTFGEPLAAHIEALVEADIALAPDERCGESYKRQVAGVLVRRAIADAVADAATRRLAP